MDFIHRMIFQDDGQPPTCCFIKIEVQHYYQIIETSKKYGFPESLKMQRIKEMIFKINTSNHTSKLHHE